MTCRHRPGDPSCSSSPEGARREADLQVSSSLQQARKQITELQAQLASSSPDNTKFDIDEVAAVGPHLVLRVLYPNCAKCAYEGKKVLVYLNVSVLQAMKWRVIDPHFRADAPRTVKEAPAPSARFPASDGGWKDALAWAQKKARGEEGIRDVRAEERIGSSEVKVNFTRDEEIRDLRRRRNNLTTQVEKINLRIDELQASCPHQRIEEVHGDRTCLDCLLEDPVRRSS